MTDDQHKEFYQFIAKAWDSYQYKLHFNIDAPVHVNALLYIPQRHNEFMGMGRMQPGVSLYSRRVLIQSNMKNLLPDYLRFVKGVVDSEDLPMNLSREMVQNNRNGQAGGVVKKLSDIVTGKVLRWIQEEARRDPKKYLDDFYKSFSMFIKEGICTAESKHQVSFMIYDSRKSDATYYFLHSQDHYMFIGFRLGGRVIYL